MEQYPGTDYAKLGGIINGLLKAQCYEDSEDAPKHCQICLRMKMLAIYCFVRNDSYSSSIINFVYASVTLVSLLYQLCKMHVD